MWTRPADRAPPCGPCGQAMEKLRFPTACPHSALSRPQPHRFCNNDSSERQRLQPAPGLLRHPRKSGYGTLRPIAVGIPRPIARNNTPRRSGEAGPVRSQPPPGQDPPRGVWPVRGDEPSPARGGQAGDFRLPGLHALLHDDPARTLSAWSQTGCQTGQQDPGAHRRGAPQALAPRHLGGRKVVGAGL